MKIKLLALILLMPLTFSGCTGNNDTETKNNQEIVIADYSSGKELANLTKQKDIDDLVDSLSLENMDEWDLNATTPKTSPTWKITFYQSETRKAFQRSRDLEVEETLSVNVYANECITATKVMGRDIYLGIPDSTIQQLETFIKK